MNTLNIGSREKDPRARILSALANRPFQLEEYPYTFENYRWFASLEGWYQGIKFPQHDQRRYEAFSSCFGYAKAFSRLAECNFVWWGFDQFPYGGPQHKELIETAFRASIPVGSDREKALIATKGLILTHETGEADAPDSPLTKAEFAELMMQIRAERLEE